MVKIRRLGSDIKTGSSSQEDNSVDNSVYQICTDRVRRRSIIRKLSGIHAEERSTLGCIPVCITRLKQKKHFVQNYKIPRRLDKKSLVLDPQISTAVPGGAAVDLHENSRIKLYTCKELSKNVPELSTCRELSKRGPGLYTYRELSKKVPELSTCRELSKNVPKKSHHGTHSKRRHDDLHLKTIYEAASSGVSKEQSDTMRHRRFSNEDLKQRTLVHKDTRSEICGGRLNKVSYQNTRGLSQNQNNSVTYIRQPVMDDEWNRLVRKWQSQDKNNQLDTYKQHGVRRRSQDNNHEQPGTCLCCKFPAAETPRDSDGYPKKTRAEIWEQWKCSEPNVVYVCDKGNLPDGQRQHPTTTVYLCEMAKQTRGDDSPKKTKQSYNTIGTKTDIAPSHSRNTKFNYRVPDLPPEKCFEDVVCETGQDSAWCCQPPCKPYPMYPPTQQTGGWNVSLTSPARFLQRALISLLRWIFIFSVFFLILIGLLIFINFNTFGHYCVLALVVLFLYILILAPDNLLIYYYLM